MKIKSILFASILILSAGCSYLPSNSNKSVSDNAVDSTIGAEKIGVPECDEAFEEIAKMLSQNDDDSFLTQAAKRAAVNKIRENLKQKIEENKTDKAKLAKDCREYKSQIDKFKTEEKTNKK